MEAFEFLGKWWLPGEEAKAVPGVVNFSNQTGINLALMGSLEEVQEVEIFKIYPIILGVTQKGKLITLCDCTTMGNQLIFNRSLFTNQNFKVYTAYIGFHFADIQDIKFYKIALQYSFLPHWVQFPPIRPNFILNEKGGIKKAEYSYTPPDAISTETDKGVVTITSSFESNVDLLQGVNVGLSTWMKIETENKLSIKDWSLYFIRPLQNLFTLATCRPNSILRLDGYTTENYIIRSHGEKEELPIQIIFHQDYSETKVSKWLPPQEMLFILQDIRDDFGQIIQNWLTIAENLDSVCSLFFAVQYAERMYLEQKFLTIIQAVESYHRRSSDKKDLSEEDHKKRIEAILAGAPQEYKKWLTDKLKYSNELSLRQRLKDLLSDEDKSQIIVPLIGKKSMFIDTVVNTRNYMTHYDESLKKKIATGEKLFRLITILSFLLQSCFLHELGVKVQHSRDLISRNNLYQEMLRRKL